MRFIPIFELEVRTNNRKKEIKVELVFRLTISRRKSVLKFKLNLIRRDYFHRSNNKPINQDIMDLMADERKF